MPHRKVDDRRRRLVALRRRKFRTGGVMNRRIRTLGAAAAVASIAFALVAVAQHAGSASHTSWATPLTASGQPDFQGHWTNDTYTPLERPAELGDKQTFTPEEAAAFFRSKVDELNAQAADDRHPGNRP